VGGGRRYFPVIARVNTFEALARPFLPLIVGMHAGEAERPDRALLGPIRSQVMHPGDIGEVKARPA
jgi:hypothetical protein